MIVVAVVIVISGLLARDKRKWVINLLECGSQLWSVLNSFGDGGKPNETWSARVARVTKDQAGNYTRGNLYFRVWVWVLGKRHLDWASEPDGD